MEVPLEVQGEKAERKKLQGGGVERKKRRAGGGEMGAASNMTGRLNGQLESEWGERLRVAFEEHLRKERTRVKWKE